MSEHPASMPGAREEHPVGTAPRWGVSSADWRSHAVDEDADHPDGVYVVRCGQRLVRDTSLYDVAPGWMCLSCLRWVGQPRPVRWARSPLDYHTHLLLPEGDHPPGVLKARCGALMLSSTPRHDQPPSGLTCADCHLIFLADSNAWSPQDE